MGDLLALVRRAPGPLQTLAGAVTTWMHQERLDAVRERLADLYGYDVTTLRFPQNVADRFRSTPGASHHPAGSAAYRSSPEISSTSYVVVAPPDRWRIVERGHVEACDGRQSWTGTATLVTESPGEPGSIREAGVIGLCLYPGPLVSGLRFTSPKEAELEGRACWVADAELGLPAGAMPIGGALGFTGGRRLSDFVGVDHRFWFDIETGIVLRHEGSIDGELCSTIELTDVVVDRPLGSREFGVPPGAVVRSPHELLRDHLVGLGVDPDTIDLDDPAEVRRALRGAI